jgi:hypothetical protein
VRDRYTQTANTWTAMHLVEIGRYSFEEVCHWLHPWLRYHHPGHFSAGRIAHLKHRLDAH